MAEQRRRAKEARKAEGVDDERIDTYRELVEQFGTTEFTGYSDTTTTGTRVLAVLPVDDGVEIFLDRTPFYAESGGQVGDTGEVVTSWGRGGRTAAQFKWVHGIAVDSKGKLYTAEVGYGRRAQKFSRAIDAAGLPAGSCPGRSARGRPWRLNDMHKKDPGSWGGRGFFRTVGRGDRDRSSIALLRE